MSTALASPIAVGAQAPDFQLPDQNGTQHTLAQYRGKNVVLAFYPLDFSPVCSKEHACFTSGIGAFEGLNAQVIGVSVDSMWAHKAYAEKMGINYPLLADFNPRGGMAKQFGLYLEDKGITNRATVVIDKNGVVAAVTVHDLPETRDNGEILKVLGTLG